MKSTTEIRITIEGDEFVARCPAVPDCEGRGEQESVAVNRCVAAVRAFIAECDDKLVPWIEPPYTEKPKDCRVIQLTGVRPAQTREIKPQSTAKPKDAHVGEAPGEDG